jgi:hypothetical protein
MALLVAHSTTLWSATAPVRENVIDSRACVVTERLEELEQPPSVLLSDYALECIGPNEIALSLPIGPPLRPSYQNRLLEISAEKAVGAAVATATGLVAGTEEP